MMDVAARVLQLDSCFVRTSDKFFPHVIGARVLTWILGRIARRAHSHCTHQQQHQKAAATIVPHALIQTRLIQTAPHVNQQTILMSIAPRAALLIWILQTRVNAFPRFQGQIAIRVVLDILHPDYAMFVPPTKCLMQEQKRVCAIPILQDRRAQLVRILER